MKIKKVSKNYQAIAKQEKVPFLKNKKYWVIFIGLFLIAIMAGSALVEWKGSENEYDYNGFNVIKTETGYLVGKEGNNIFFNYDPKTVENIPMMQFSITNQRVYISTEPVSEITSSLELNGLKQYLNMFGLIAIQACTSEDGCPDIPLVKCNGTEKIVLLKQTNKTSITTEDNCIILNYASNEDEIKVVDAFVYKLVGVL